MLSTEDYIRLSIQHNLFWIRIMKEHAIFIEATMPPPGRQYALQAGRFRQNYDRLMRLTIRLSNGVIKADDLHSGQFYTQYTLEAERQTQVSTGINIDTNLTQMEHCIEPYNKSLPINAYMEQSVGALNENLLSLTNSFVRFKAELLELRTTCGLFTMMYTADIEHVLLEAQRYQKILVGLQNRVDLTPEDDIIFWTQNMAGHAKVMRGELDPTQGVLINQANAFANTFDTLANEEISGCNTPTDSTLLTETQDIAGFKAMVTQDLIHCKVQAILLSLYTDHLLREANHFIWLLK
ncbi:hypothetical protein DSECCO2_326260 [anaerobic digester metagenome]